MKKVQKIDNKYISDDCVQVMIPYYDTLTIIDENGILYHHKTGSELNINKYLQDERRRQFPYVNIPTRFFGFHLTHKMNYTNQLLEFEKPYISIGDGLIKELYVIKDESESLLVSITNESKSHTKHMSYEELLNYIKNEQLSNTYYIYLSGSIPDDITKIVPTEEELHNHIKKLVSYYISIMEKHVDYGTTIGFYLWQNPWVLDYFSNNLDNIDYSSINFNIKIKDPLIIVRINSGNIEIQYLEITYVKDNDYRVDIYDIPVTKYSLEQLKIVSLKSNRVNDIKEVKQMIRILKR